MYFSKEQVWFIRQHKGMKVDELLNDPEFKEVIADIKVISKGE